MIECRDMMTDYYLGNIDKKINIKEIYNLIMCLNDIYNSLKEASNRKIIIEVNLLKFMNTEDFNKEESKTNEIQQEKPKQISREIKPKEEKKIKKYEINLDIKKQMINNTFAMASKVLKNMAKEKWKKLNDYLVSNDYSYIAGLLKDVEVSVVSSKNMILTSKYDSIIENIYQEYDKVSELINIIMENNYKVVILSNKEFEEEVNKYKEHMKDPNYYEYKEEEKTLIKYVEQVEKNNDLGYTKLVNKAIDVFGTDVVEIE